MRKFISNFIVLALVLLIAAPPWAGAQEGGSAKGFGSEELEQILAPVALYPDSLLTQVLMASTYPLEVVQADRWAKQNKNLKGDALAAALEKQPWDPSVKSLVNFPEVLGMMSEKLDWTQKMGDAFLSQQKDVMASIQSLRWKAEKSGNLKSSKEQKVIVEKETIVIQPASPEVIYVPAYNPTVVYGAWPYPAYPPYPYYPPGYAAGAAAFGFVSGVAVGAAWGYAWGHADWHGGDVDVDVNRNANFNRNIDRGKYADQYKGGKGNWQHNPEHRKGVSYRDQGTAQKFNRGSSNKAVQSRENFRGRADAGRQDIARGGADQFKGRGGQEGRGGQTMQRGGSAFSGMDRGGSATRDMSNRGSSSRQSMSSGGRGGSLGGGRSSGGFGGAGRGGSGGGAGRGGGRR
jgi:hypothetical protein